MKKNKFSILSFFQNRTILILSVFFVIGMGIIFKQMFDVAYKIKRETTKEEAKLLLKSLEDFRTLYTSEVVVRAKTQGIEVAHDYLEKEGAIPLPATLSMMLGDLVGEGDVKASASLYSDYPFPWRKEERGVLSDAQRNVISQLRKKSSESIVLEEEIDGQKFLRVAKADVMRESCIKCHNTHPQSPKRDWKVGDVRGVLEVVIPLQSEGTKVSNMLFGISILIFVITALGLGIVFVSIKKLRKEKMSAEVAAKAKADFLANMSHEIRTPMNAILGFSDLLKKTSLNEKQRTYLSTIQSSGQLLVGIIDDILDINKLESGKINMEAVDFNLEQTIHEVFKMVVTRMQDKPFDTYVDYSLAVPTFVKGDPTRVKQIFVNLLGNAIKFTSQGEIGVIVRVHKKQAADDKLALAFTVRDTGIGIEPDKVDKIFESFTQADESTTRKFGGTGLGLTITKALVEAMGGEIRIESELGKGSDFNFNLVFDKSSKDSSDVKQPQVPEAVINKTVFIVDDNQVSLKMIESCCEKLSLKIIGISNSPYEALHKLDKLIHTKDMVPDIILSDIVMEGMNGFQMVEKIKGNEKFKNTLFIAITADIKAETENDPNKQKFNVYVTKPFSPDALINAFNSILQPNAQGDISEKDELIDSCKGVKVLVVEDVIPNQLLIQEYFNQLGCEVDFANNGQEAVDQLKQNQEYDVCFMDLQMPVMGGVEATRKIREEITKDLPIIALTAAVLPEDREEAVEVGMNDFLEKPVACEKLKDMIHKYAKKLNE